VYAALEIRLYALALLLSALLWLAFHDGYLSEQRPRARVWFVVLAVTSIYVQYFLAFALVAGAAALIVARRYEALRAFMLACALVAVAIAPVLWWAPAQASAAYLTAASLREILGGIVQPAMTFALPASDWTGPWRLLGYAHHAVELVAVVFLFGFSAKRLGGREWAIVTLPIFMWCVFFLGAAILHLHYTPPRHLVGLYLPEIAALYVLVSRVAVDGRSRLALGIAVLYALFSAATLIATYRSLAKPGDWPRVAAYLSQRVRGGERIAVFPARAVPAFVRGYRGPGEVSPFPGPENLQRYDERSARIASSRDASVALQRLAAGQVVWLVIGEDCATAAPADGCGYLESAVAQSFPKAPEETFYHNRVVQISVPADHSAHAPP